MARFVLAPFELGKSIGSNISGKSRDSLKEECERIQKFEDLVDHDYDPFHRKCGKNVVFSTKQRLIATRRKGSGGEIVFSAGPIPVGAIFQVKLLEKEGGFIGSLVSARAKSL